MNIFLPDAIEELSHAYLLEGNQDEFIHALQNYFKEKLGIEDLYNHIDCTVISCQGIKVDAVRDILKSLSIYPYFEKKIIVMTFFHEASVFVQNILLKSLEDPPAYGHFFLLCNHTQQVLSTIISRCISIFRGVNYTEPLDMNFIYQLESNDIQGFLRLSDLGHLQRDVLLEKLKDFLMEIYQEISRRYLKEDQSQKLSLDKLLKIAEAIDLALKRLKANCGIKASVDAMVYQIMEAKL